MSTIRTVDRIIWSVATREGAGVKLQRAFGFREKSMLDPFLMLDHFGSDNPEVSYCHETPPGYTVFAYVHRGGAYFDSDRDALIDPGHTVLFGAGDTVEIATGEELDLAFREYDEGTFIKHGKDPS